MRATVLCVAAVLAAGCNQTPENQNPGLSEKQTKEAQSIADMAAAKATKELALAIRGAIEKQEELNALIKATTQEINARIELESTKREAAIAHITTEKTEEEYEDDIRTAAILDGPELLMLISVHEKIKNGGQLTDDEWRLASRFHSQREFVKPEIERRAKARGLYPKAK